MVDWNTVQPAFAAERLPRYRGRNHTQLTEAMANTLILDTNVFYNLGGGRLATAAIKADSAEVLCYSPLTTLELAGKWSSRTFEARRDAARAILSSGARELPDPDRFLTQDIFGYAPADAAFSVAEGVKAMAQSSTMKELVAGVRDLNAWVVRKVSVPTAHRWRQVTEAKWLQDMLGIQKARIPKFAAWYNPDPTLRKGPVPHLRGKDRAEFLKSMTSHEWLATLVVACQERALLGAKRTRALVPTKESVTKLMRALDSVACYSAIYTQYLIRLLTDGALPEANDSGDLELFIYATDDSRIVVTSERKWRRLAELAGFGGRVRLV